MDLRERFMAGLLDNADVIIDLERETYLKLWGLPQFDSTHSVLDCFRSGAWKVEEFADWWPITGETRWVTE